jgi:hypothetical protein
MFQLLSSFPSSPSTSPIRPLMTIARNFSTSIFRSANVRNHTNMKHSANTNQFHFVHANHNSTRSWSIRGSSPDPSHCSVRTNQTNHMSNENDFFKNNLYKNINQIFHSHDRFFQLATMKKIKMKIKSVAMNHRIPPPHHRHRHRLPMKYQILK